MHGFLLQTDTSPSLLLVVFIFVLLPSREIDIERRETKEERASLKSGHHYEIIAK